MLLAKNKIIIWFFSLFFILCQFDVFAMSSDEASAFANFVKGLADSSSGMDGNKSCFFGSDEITQFLSKFHEFQQISDLSKTQSCKAIYIAKNKEKALRIEITKIKRKNIMTIAIFNDFIEIGGTILIKMGRRSFELTLNKEVMKNSGLRLSPLAADLIVN